MNVQPTAPDGGPIEIRPIQADELGRVVLRCWPERATIDRLFAFQATIGLAAWHGGRCVAELHGYRVLLPDSENPHWPRWNNWWTENVRQAVAQMRGPAWCHACIHVGRTLASGRQESLALVRRFASANDWDVTQTGRALNALDGVAFADDAVRRMVEQLRTSGQTHFRPVETQYQGRGIGTALCRASVAWAREHGYAWVLAMGAPDGLRAHAQFAGRLPWTNYARLGFQSLPLPGQDPVPAWAQDAAPPDVVTEAETALRAGRPPATLRARLMALDLGRAKAESQSPD